jgi:hypothetical protein
VRGPGRTRRRGVDRTSSFVRRTPSARWPIVCATGRAGRRRSTSRRSSSTLLTACARTRRDWRNALTTRLPKREACSETPVSLSRPRSDALKRPAIWEPPRFRAREFGAGERGRGRSWLGRGQEVGCERHGSRSAEHRGGRRDVRLQSQQSAVDMPEAPRHNVRPESKPCPIRAHTAECRSAASTRPAMHGG